MTHLRRVVGPLFSTGFVLVASICSGGQGVRNLLINGQVASTDVRVINGKTYVPISDVAKALNMALTTTGSNLVMAPAGGANQVGGLQGKLGETIFTGKWRFTAISIEQMDSYAAKHGDPTTYTPKSPSETLFVVQCRIKNAQKDTKEMVFTVHQKGSTALTDDMEHSFAPIDFDAHDETGPYGGPKMLPGSAAEFAVIFSAPKGTMPKDLVFSIISGDDLHTNGKPGIDLRISLK